MKDLDRLLRPKNIAVIGGGFWCKNVVAQCKKIGFTGEIWPIHPTETSMSGCKVYSRLEDLPGTPDATFIGVNRHATIGLVAELANMKAGGAICFASGFSESQGETNDGERLQQELVAAAGEMPIIGPNCYGLINYVGGACLWPDQHGGRSVKSGVAIITQSSNIAINLTMQRRGLPIAYIVTAGNQAQTGMSEIAMSLLDDPHVTALGLHVEGIDDLAKFQALALKAAEIGKPIVVVKVGASEQAQMATISHTASLAGSDAGARALMRRLGILQVESLSTLLETLKLLHIAGRLGSYNIASMSCSGGEASLFADSALGSELNFPKLSQIQKSELRSALGPKVKLANPLDYHTYIWGDGPAMVKAFTAMMDPALALGCIIVDFPRNDRCSAEDWDCVIEAAIATKRAKGVPIALISSLPENLPEDVATKLIDHGLIPLCGMTEAIEAINAAARAPLISHAPILAPRICETEKVLSEFEAKSFLKAHGLAVPRSFRFDDQAALGQGLRDLKFPVVLKGEGVAHKSEAGAVILNLANADAVFSAASDMQCGGYLVEEMVTQGVCELLIGVTLDPAHGYVLTIAAGGVLTEILCDRVNMLIPASRDDIREGLMSLKIAPLFTGYRGATSVNIDAVLDAVLGLQDFVGQHSVIEAEINPLICTPTHAFACDALIKIGEEN